MIKCSAMKLIHNIIKFKTPIAIFEMFRINKRSNVDVVTIYRPKTQKTEKFYLYNALKLYNKLPKSLKEKHDFKGELKKHLLLTCDSKYIVHTKKVL